MNIYFFRLSQAIKFGWADALTVSRKHNVSRVTAYCDIIKCFFKYYLRSVQYVKEDFWSLSKEERKIKGKELYKKNISSDNWTKENYENKKFLNKWKQYRWETDGYRYHKRLMAYTKRYNLGKGCIVHSDVILEQQHGLCGSITIGDNVLLAKHVYIDYSGEVIISNNVKLSAGVTIESHSHEFVPGSSDYKAKPTSILIKEGVWVGQKAIICESCKSIGRYAQIGAGSTIRSSIPPYAIVIGNPAKIVGFVLNPEEVVSFENQNFFEKKTDIDKYRSIYEKYLLNRIKDVKQFTKL